MPALAEAATEGRSRDDIEVAMAAFEAEHKDLGAGHAFRWVEPESARDGFLQRSFRFIRSRMFATRASAESISMTSSAVVSRSASPTARPIRVVTREDGWRVSYSPAYFVRARYFGAPSTPVDGELGPGIWIFGVDRGGPIAWDSAEFEVPPIDRAELMIG